MGLSARFFSTGIPLVVVACVLLQYTDCYISRPTATSKTCVYFNPLCRKNCKKVEICPIYQGKVSHCFALYKNTTQGVEFIRQGCWLQNKAFCPMYPFCINNDINSKHGIEFCCCTGDECNRNPLPK
ncbi:activin receptor type-2A [Nematostella vectensis]|uniref:activin receptor type-2A n=1 Tax=Nematostella vectensis TaxID=45351 RepID=UPI0013903CE7|nr:activin receptor type-2A [Nematostella vectensis]XP_032237308.1 activin receptor type-2A [Nematostella vectensis]